MAVDDICEPEKVLPSQDFGMTKDAQGYGARESMKENLVTEDFSLEGLSMESVSCVFMYILVLSQRMKNSFNSVNTPIKIIFCLSFFLCIFVPSLQISWTGKKHFLEWSKNFLWEWTPRIFNLKAVLTSNIPEKIYYSAKAFSSA